MSAAKTVRYLAAVLFIVSVVSACSDDPKNTSQERVRRANAHNSTTTKPTKPTTTASVPATNPIVTVPYLNPAEIAKSWNEPNLCGLIKPADAQKILDMDTAPVPQYSYSASSGARCTYSTGAGEEMYVELSTTTYANARAVDIALHVESDPIVVDGVGGISKTKKVIGTTYELNYSGAESNEWVVNAPKNLQTQDLTKLLIAALH